MRQRMEKIIIKDSETFQSLLNLSESETLDFKSKQYPFSSDEEKAGCFQGRFSQLSNAWKISDGYILIGIEEEHGRVYQMCVVQKLRFAIPTFNNS